MDTRFKNTDFFIEDIDESVKDLTVNDSSVSHLPANTDFFIENIDNNVIEICTDRGITPTTVSVVPANTDFFIVNIDSNVKKIASDLSITPSSVEKVPANTDFFIENIYSNIILICIKLNIDPSEITVTLTNTDFFIEAIAKNVEKIMEAQTEIHVSGTFIHAVLSADSKISDYELEGNATQNGTPTPDAPVAINTVTGEQVVGVVGKNLFGIEDAPAITQNGITISVSDGAININGTATASFGVVIANLKNGIVFKNGMSYTLSKEPSGSVDGYWALQFRDANGGNIVETNPYLYPTTISNASGTAKAIRLYIASGRKFTNYSIKIQLELGSTATTYEPYQGQEFTIDLGSIELAKIGTYQDRIYKDGEKWYVEKQINKSVFNGSENWQTATVRENVMYFLMQNIFPLNGGAYEIVPSMSNYFTPTSFWNALSQGSTYDNVFFFHDSNHYIAFKDSAVSSLADFKAWLGTHPTTVYYTLATPTTTEITDETLLAQLNAIYALELKEGEVNISITATSPNLPATLKATIIPKE